MKLRKGKANADFNRKNGGNGGNSGDADRDGPDWPARHSHFVEHCELQLVTRLNGHRFGATRPLSE